MIVKMSFRSNDIIILYREWVDRLIRKRSFPDGVIMGVRHRSYYQYKRNTNKLFHIIVGYAAGARGCVSKAHYYRDLFSPGLFKE